MMLHNALVKKLNFYNIPFWCMLLLTVHFEEFNNGRTLLLWFDIYDRGIQLNFVRGQTKILSTTEGQSKFETRNDHRQTERVKEWESVES